MGPVLQGLIKLQSIENRLRAAKSKLTRCRRQVIFQENQIRTLQNQFDAKKEEIRLTKVQSDRLELELRSRDDEIAKLRAALNQAKSNKEYSAILTQMNTTKADNSKIETQVLELMKNIETDEAFCEQLKSQITEQKEKLEVIRKESDAKAVDFETEVQAIQTEWDQAAKELPDKALDVFKRVCENYDGEALAVAEKADGSDTYSCGGCFMGLRLEIVNTLLTKDDIIRCPNCTRIVVLGDERD